MPDEPAYLNESGDTTYAGLLSSGEALARALLDLGIRPGEVIAFQTPNWFEAAVINLAASLGGFVIAPIVHIYRDAEVQHMLADSGARAFFVAEKFRAIDYAAMVDRITPGLPDLAHVVLVRPAAPNSGLAALIEHGSKLTHSLPNSDPDSVKLVLYTSGTTGRPKAVLHSHNTLARVIDVTAEYLALGRDTVLMPSPVTHITGYAGALEKPFQVDARAVLMEQWDAQKAVELIERFGITSTVAATPFLVELCAAAQQAGAGLASLRSFACGGASVPPDLVRSANSSMAHPCVARVYGSSEVPQATQGYRASVEPDLAATSDGHAIDYDIRICNDEDCPLPVGSEGEVQVRGPAMFLGYGDPQQTSGALTADGYFRTGDIGRIGTGGELTITGRKKDLIIRGGENISAREIEEVLDRHPAVAESSVVAMPHQRLGEGVCAFVILLPGNEVTKADLVEHVRHSGLALQKCPEHIELVSDFPRTASGKVRKDQLRDEARRLVSAQARS